MTFGKQNQKEDGIQKHLKIIIIIFQTPSTFHIQRIPQQLPQVTGSNQQFVTNIFNRNILCQLFVTHTKSTPPADSILNIHSHFSWTFLSKGERCMRLSLCEAPTQKEQHNGQPQHRETTSPTLFQQCGGSLTSHIELINIEGIVRRDLRFIVLIREELKV